MRFKNNQFSFSFFHLSYYQCLNMLKKPTFECLILMLQDWVIWNRSKGSIRFLG